MEENISRRDFLKTASVTAGVSTLSLPSMVFPFSSTRDKSLVVIAKDEQCFSTSTGVDQPRIQDMVDHTIMTLTGKTDKAEAYKALFKNGVSSSTKIAIKYNNSRVTLTRPAIIKALKTSLTSLCDVSESNISVIGRASEGGANSNQKFKIGSTEYAVKEVFADCDYYINLPACWSLTAGCGVTLGLKAPIAAVGGSVGDMHSYFLNESTPSLSILNNQPAFKDKLALVFIDGICIGTKSGQNPNNTAHCVIATKDVVASDVQGIILLKQYGLATEFEDPGKKVCELAAKAPYNLGVADPEKMEVVQIGPPWTTQIISSGNIKSYDMYVKTRLQGNKTVFAISDDIGTSADLFIYDIHGKRIWTKTSVLNNQTWDHCYSNGNRVAAGIYLFKLTAKHITAHGKFDVR